MALIIRQEAPVVLGDHLGLVLDGVACLFVRPGILSFASRARPDVCAAMRQRARVSLDRLYEAGAGVNGQPD